MLLRTFRNQMDVARAANKRADGQNGLCGTLRRNVNHKAMRIFQNFEPRNVGYAFWLSTYCDHNNDGMTILERRELFLDAFQGYMESTKRYKEL